MAAQLPSADVGGQFLQPGSQDPCAGSSCCPCRDALDSRLQKMLLCSCSSTDSELLLSSHQSLADAVSRKYVLMLESSVTAACSTCTGLAPCKQHACLPALSCVVQPVN